jgi:serine/threonine protein kinase
VNDETVTNSIITRNDIKKDTSAQISIGGHIFKNEIHFSLFCNDYEDMEVLGNGGFGIVQKVRHLKTNETRAMKIINRNDLRQNVNGEKHLLREIAILKKLVIFIDNRITPTF